MLHLQNVVHFKVFANFGVGTGTSVLAQRCVSSCFGRTFSVEKNNGAKMIFRSFLIFSCFG